jgi:hypothetical protein
LTSKPAKQEHIEISDKDAASIVKQIKKKYKVLTTKTPLNKSESNLIAACNRHIK